MSCSRCQPISLQATGEAPSDAIQYAEQAYSDLFVDPEESPQKVDILSPPTLFTLAAHACSILLCPCMEIKSPVRLREYVRSLMYVHSPFLRFKVLKTIIQPRVRRIIHSMHADGTPPFPKPPPPGAISAATGQPTAEEVEYIGERVCALLCEHAYSADSLLALRTACAEDLPTVTQAAVAYLAHTRAMHVKENNPAKEKPPSKAPLQVASETLELSAPAKSKVLQPLSWRSGNIKTLPGNKQGSNTTKPLTADSKPWRPPPSEPPSKPALDTQPPSALSHTSKLSLIHI